MVFEAIGCIAAGQAVEVLSNALAQCPISKAQCEQLLALFNSGTDQGSNYHVASVSTSAAASSMISGAAGVTAATGVPSTSLSSSSNAHSGFVDTMSAAQICYETGNYTSNSTYRANLDGLLTSIINNTKIDYGFYNFSAGESPNKVYAIALCSGDASPSVCRSCINESRYELLQACPNQKEAIHWAWRKNYCLIRYSYKSIFNILATDPKRGSYRVANAVDVEAFNNVLGPLLDSLRKRAAKGNSTRKFALQSVPAPNFQTIYSLLQCTPDLSELDCNTCLQVLQGYTSSCCNGKQGGIFRTPSCVLRYETYSFYDPSAESPPPPPPLPPPTAASPPPELPTSTPGKESNSSRTVIIVVVTTIASIVSAVLIIFISICIYLRARIPVDKAEIDTDDQISVVECLQFDFGKIRVATQNFSDANKLGKGGFGVVYKGRLPNGQEIAVKRLSKNSSQGEIEFKNEVMLVARLQHRHLVRLLGFCWEGDERLLVYEFLPNASLDRFIFDSIKRAQLNWEIRYKIIGGIARGLLYLHEDSQIRIIHRDLKASNILLDAYMNPKISDFGMARLFQLDQTQENTNRIVGTYGYMPPEYLLHGQFSVKSDVFSFGVLVLEMVTGQKNNTFRGEDNGEGLLNYAWKKWKDGTTSNLIDPTLCTDSTTEIIKCIHIGLLCVQENMVKRPTMASVVLMLNSESMTLSIPSRPAFTMYSNTRSSVLHVEHKSGVMGSTQSRSSSVQASVNDVSITELDPWQC
nr:cysteine-rich receptor-like protein kinase 26 [Quercus suber]